MLKSSHFVAVSPSIAIAGVSVLGLLPKGLLTVAPLRSIAAPASSYSASSLSWTASVLPPGKLVCDRAVAQCVTVTLSG